ncbi:sodium channel protein Nach [Dendroctonus ponderosae]|uniref:sodium channel protein Nach n=1 Tax=Dendroctonus ponderosae TaxID=77166 RepID=UPI002034A869|nr:sodium channel protein Nach [Dendroctonus ponderosae]
MSLKKGWIDFATNGSIHGFKYMVDSSISVVERVFWIIIVLCSLAASIYITILFWARYAANPTRTIIQANFAQISTVPFPAVTICNVNKMLNRKLDSLMDTLSASKEELNITGNIISALMRTTSFYETSAADDTKINNSTALSIATTVLKRHGFLDISQVIPHISQGCDEMIHKCEWNRVEVPCQDLFSGLLTEDGRCCAFNYASSNDMTIKYTLYYGMSTGLRITLHPEYNHRAIAGIIVTIHNPKNFPDGEQNLRKILPLGHAHYVQVGSIKQTCSEEVKKLDITFRKCVYSEERRLGLLGPYTYSNCLTLCKAHLSDEKCNCIPYYFQLFLNKQICTFMDQQCLQNNVTTESFRDCNNCPAQCEEDVYDITLTSAKFTNNLDVWMEDYFSNFNETQKAILLNIFFAFNGQTVWVTDTITSGIYLISSFGGIYSLFLGCSIISIIEALYYLIKGHLFWQKSINQNTIFPKQLSTNFIVLQSDKAQKSQNSFPIIPYIN